MAYKNLVNQNCVGFTEEAFQRVRDFICKRNGTYDYSVTGIGWTLHDSYYATDEDNCAIGDWFVVKSVGESGDEDLYFRFKWHEADHINIQGMLYWNAGTDTGVKKYPASDTNDLIMCDDDLAFPLWVYGDLDQLAIITKTPTNYYSAIFGCARALPYDTTVATCAGALSSGSDISIVVDVIPSEWAVDRYLFIRDTAEIDRIKIKTLNGGTKTITADLTHSFLAGNKLCADLNYYCPSTSRFDSTTYQLINHTGAGVATVVKGFGAGYSWSNPDDMNAEPIGESIALGQVSVGYMGKVKNIYRIASSIPGVNSEDVFTDLDGVDWRVINVYNGCWLMLKEV
jgi:hypothetical protein